MKTFRIGTLMSSPLILFVKQRSNMLPTSSRRFDWSVNRLLLNVLKLPLNGNDRNKKLL
jgi:hypothetical protein